MSSHDADSMVDGQGWQKGASMSVPYPQTCLTMRMLEHIMRRLATGLSLLSLVVRVLHESSGIQPSIHANFNPTSNSVRHTCSSL